MGDTELNKIRIEINNFLPIYLYMKFHSLLPRTFSNFFPNNISLSLASAFLFLLQMTPAARNYNTDIPHLVKHGTATQLIVEGKPFLILGGELGNSTASDLIYLDQYWENFKEINLNTILAPVYWELIEPQEGKFDFSLVEGLIRDARKHDLKLVLLWFGSWKNSMSCYAPSWIKTDFERFPRSVNKNGKSMEILTPFSRQNLEADKKAFAALMRFIREIDNKEHTVIMVQVENEVGIIPDARDYYDRADELFMEKVPEELMSYLRKNKEKLIPEFYNFWEKNGFRTSGSWEEIFGKNHYTEEVFMAWHFAKYINEIAEAGKNEYPLPMFVNAALIREGYLPGQYPSAGPLPHIMDIWRAGAPQIDFLSPDIYFPNFREWCEKYDRSGNPLFIPEAQGDHRSAANVLYAVGRHDAIGFSPFAIESVDPDNHRLTKSYEMLRQIAPVILNNQGSGNIEGVLLDKDNPEEKIMMDDYIIKFSFELNDRYAVQPPEENPRAGGIIIQTGPGEYIVAGSGLIVTFESLNPELPLAGILSIDEGKYIDGVWHSSRRLNGDQSHQGRHMRLSYWNFEIQRVKLYQYK